jgi:Rad3-related DNA helicase
MDDMQILKQIHELVDEEHVLRDRLNRGEISNDREQERLTALEESLDQCWDLLRQRRARREFGEDPDQAAERPAAEVEGYLQ